MLLLLCLVLHASSAQLGEEVEQAVAVHVTQGGLAHLGDAVEAMVPPVFPVSEVSGQYACADDDAVPLDYTLAPVDLHLVTDEVALVASEGWLDLAVYATLWSDPTTLVVQGDCSVLTDLDETCGVEIPTTAVEVHLGLALEPVDGRIDVVADPIQVAISPIQNPLDDCTLASAVGTMLGQDEAVISDLLLSLVEPDLAELPGEIEQALEQILDTLAVDTSFALGDAEMTLELHPTRVEVGEAGVVVGMGALVDTDLVDDCVPWQDGFEETGAGWPELGETAADTTLAYDVGLLVGKDFVDQVLFTAWASGLMCMEVSELGGADLEAGLLGSFLGEDFQETFEPSAPAAVLLDPVVPPWAWFDHDRPPLHVAVEALQIELVSELDARQVRVFQVEADADLGLDVVLETESLSTELVIAPGALQLTEVWAELLRPGYSHGLSELAESLLGSLLPDDLLPEVALPSLMGVEIGGTWWIPTSDGAWQGAYVVLDTTGVQPVEVPGCGGDGVGCEGGSGTGFDWEEALGCGQEGGSSGCDAESGGADCATVPPVTWPVGRGLVVILVLAGAARRRSRD